MRFGLYGRLSWRQGAWVFGAFGLAALTLAAAMTWRATVELRAWPRVEAHVDTADVVTTGGVNGRALYAARLRLSYRYQGHDYRTFSTMPQEWDVYGFAAQAAAKRLQAGRVLVMLDPDRPGSAVPREGSGLSFIFAGFFGFFGFAFLAVAFLARRTGQRQGLDRLSPANLPASPRFAITLFVGTGALFIISAAIGAVIGPDGKNWTPAQGRVERADLVETSRGMYALRTWYAYEVNGQSEHVPVTSNTSRPFAAANALASGAVLGATAPLLVDPSNPFRVTTPQASRWQGILIPMAFGVFGLILVVLGVFIRRRQAVDGSR
jgi:Protein of unknown function (DUF3592)